MKKYIVLLPPPCTNADLHMGHLAGVYMPADIYSRYLKLSGHDVITLGGADQNNTYTEKKALKIGENFRYTQDYYSKIIYKSLIDAEINCSQYVETTSKKHIDTVNEIIDILTNKNLIKIKKVNQFYCDFCNEYVVDSFASGICIYCHSQSDAGICENCNNPIFNLKLENVIHTTCSNYTSLKNTNLIVLNMDNLKHNLIGCIQRSNWDVRIKNKYLTYLESNTLDEITLSYGFKHGIKIDNISLEAKSITIWFEALWSMLTALKDHYSFNLNQVIDHLCNEDLFIVPFMGQDTEYYYAIGLSLILLGIGVNKIPHMLSVQRFIKLNEKKFSSSRNHILTINELKEKYPLDFIRYYSISILRPYCDDNNNFDLEGMSNAYLKYQTKIKTICMHVDYWRNLYYEPSVLTETKEIVNNYNIYMQNLDFYKSILEINKLLKIIFIHIQKISLSIEIACLLNMLSPIMPNISKDLWGCFFSEPWKTLISSENLCDESIKFKVLYDCNSTNKGENDVSMFKKCVDKDFFEKSFNE